MHSGNNNCCKLSAIESKAMKGSRHKLIIFNKPYDVLCQFTDDNNTGKDSQRKTLADFIDTPDVYPAGRLDRDSEGLLVLTNDGKLQSRISDPRYKLPKTYYAQVEGEVTDEAIQQLQQGVLLKDGPARALHAKHLPQPKWVGPRTPPIRQRKTIPDSWICLTLDEGRNRQVRRMTAAVGFPTLRLIRYSVGQWSLEKLPSGAWQEVTTSDKPKFS